MKTWTKEQIEEIAEDALNAACLVMQDAIGQTDGGFASLYFSGDHLIREILFDYISKEIQGLEFERSESCTK